MKNIDRDIKIVRAYLDMWEAFVSDEQLSEAKPIMDAQRRILSYAEENYRKEYVSDSMEQLTKILTGEKDEEIKKH